MNSDNLTLMRISILFALVTSVGVVVLAVLLYSSRAAANKKNIKGG